MRTRYMLWVRILVTLGLCFLAIILINTGNFESGKSRSGKEDSSKSKDPSSMAISLDSDANLKKKISIISKTRKRKKNFNRPNLHHQSRQSVKRRRNSVKANPNFQEEFENETETVHDSDIPEEGWDEQGIGHEENAYIGNDFQDHEIPEEEMRREKEEFLGLLDQVLGQTDLSEGQILEVLDIASTASQEELEKVVQEMGYPEEMYQLIDLAGITDEDPNFIYQDIQDLLYH